jgi:hypothetical protein
MSETQGRGPWPDETRINRAAKRATENGGGDDAIRTAARSEFGTASKEIMDSVRRKIRELLG